MTRRALPFLLASVVVVLALTACGGGGSSSSSAGGGSTVAASGGSAAGSSTAKGATKVTVGIPVLVPSEVPLYLGVDKGFFKRQGLDVKIVAFHGGSDLVKAVVGGSVDIGATALAGVLSGVEHGAPLKVIYGGFNQTEFQWYAQKGFSWKNAKGKRWAVSKIGSSTDFLTRYLLQQHGLDPVKDAHIVSTGGNEAILNALRSHQVDAGILAPNVGVIAKRKGFELIGTQADLMPAYPFHVIFATDGYVKGHQNVVQRFLRGLVQGMKLAKSNPKAEQQAVVKWVKVTPSIAKAIYPDDTDRLYPDGRLPDKRSMQIFWKIGLENGQFQKKLPPSQWLEPKWMNSYPAWVK